MSSFLSYAESKGYDGVNIAWEVPALEEENAFARLLAALRAGLNQWSPKGLLLVDVEIRNPGWAFDIAALSTYPDQVNFMGYELAGTWSQYVGYNSPLHRPNCGNYDSSAVETEISTWTYAGLPVAKLGLGIPLYGRIWIGNFAPCYWNQHGGFEYVSYDEIVSRKTQANSHWDSVALVPWLSSVDAGFGVYQPPWFVSYDDEDSVSIKANYAKSAGLGGIMLWEITNSTLAGTPPAQPLLEAASKAYWGW